MRDSSRPARFGETRAEDLPQRWRGRLCGDPQRWPPMLRPLHAALDHGVGVLVRDGMVQTRELTRCGLTRSDLEARLRQSAVRRERATESVLRIRRGAQRGLQQDADTPLVHGALGTEQARAWSR